MPLFFEGCAAEEPSTQRLWATRLAARLEERYGHNGWKVDDGSISPQVMIRLPKQLLTTIDKLARDQATSRSEIMRLLLTEAIEARKRS